MTGHRLAAVFFIGEKMKKIILLLLLMVSGYCAATPTSPSVTFGAANPSPSDTTFNKYDGSVYIKTSDGTATGTVDSVWHYSIKNNAWIKVPNTSTDNDSQTLTNDGLNTLTISGGNSAPIINTVTATAANQFLTVRVNGQPSSSLSLPYFQRLPLVSNASSTSTTRTLITGWQFDVTAGKNYRVEIIGTYQTAALTTGGSLGFVLTSGSGSGTIHGNMEGKVTSTNTSAAMHQSIYAVNNSAATAGSFLTTTGVGTINQPHYIGGSFIFNCTGSGTVQAQWGSEVAASAAQLNAGSVMFLTEF